MRGDCPTLFAFRLPEPDDRETVREDYIKWCQEEEPFQVLEFEVRDAAQQADWGWVLVSYRAQYRRVPGAQPEQVEKWQKWIRGTQWMPVSEKALPEYPEAPALRRLDAEPGLRRRYDETWPFRQAGDVPRLYGYVDPEDQIPVPEWRFAEAEQRLAYLSNEVHWVEVLGDRGHIRVSYEHKSNDPSMTKFPVRKTPITEYWIQRDGEWYLDIRRP